MSPLKAYYRFGKRSKFLWLSRGSLDSYSLYQQCEKRFETRKTRLVLWLDPLQILQLIFIWVGRCKKIKTYGIGWLDQGVEYNKNKYIKN